MARDRRDVLYGSLGLMVLEALGPFFRISEVAS
jgi:hypothetical protein